jgi:beta-glucosidase
VIEFLGADAPEVADGDMQQINAPMDFLGVNYYTRHMVSASEPFDVTDSGYEVTDMGWEVYPQGLTELLLRLHHDYPLPPMYIKENGAAFKDVRTGDRVHDHQRREYIANHIAAVADAIRHGVRMEGYMVWSLLDNFEWASGYEKRFGIVHVDYPTQQRTLKDSALWYRDFIQRHKASHGLDSVALATGG